MVKTGKWIAKHRILIVLIGILLLIPSVIGTIKTRINYDILSYLPESLETVKGQDVMVDEFGMGAFSMVVVENMDMKDVAALKAQFEDIDQRRQHFSVRNRLHPIAGPFAFALISRPGCRQPDKFRPHLRGGFDCQRI